MNERSSDGPTYPPNQDSAGEDSHVSHKSDTVNPLASSDYRLPRSEVVPDIVPDENEREIYAQSDHGESYWGSSQASASGINFSARSSSDGASSRNSPGERDEAEFDSDELGDRADRMRIVFQLLMNMQGLASKMPRSSVGLKSKVLCLPFAAVHTVIIDALNYPAVGPFTPLPAVLPFPKAKILILRFTLTLVEDLFYVWEANMLEIRQMAPDITELHLVLKDHSLLQNISYDRITWLPIFQSLHTVHLHLDGYYCAESYRADLSFVQSWAFDDIDYLVDTFFENAERESDEDDEDHLANKVTEAAYETLVLHLPSLVCMEWADDIPRLLSHLHRKQLREYDTVLVRIKIVHKVDEPY